MNEILTPYNVILWDFNRNDIEYYDIMPYLFQCWDEEKKRRRKIWSEKPKCTKMPKTFDEYKEFIEHYSFLRFWSRCQYETLIESNIPNGTCLYNAEYSKGDDKHTDGPYIVVKYKTETGSEDVWVQFKTLVAHYLGQGDGEILVTGFPERDKCKKIDAYTQIKMNLDVVTKVFIDNIKERKRAERKNVL